MIDMAIDEWENDANSGMALLINWVNEAARIVTVLEIDKGWLSASEFDAYSVAVANIKVGSAFAPEVRADSYFVGKPFFGLKYRHGTKLEIKVRDKNVVNGIEKWVKHKLGKKGIEKYKPEIMEILSSAGYDVTPACLEIEHQIAVEKSRHCVELEDLTLELCQLNILD
eukprot:gene22393-25368_t